MELLRQQVAAVNQELAANPRPFGQQFQELVGLLEEPILDLDLAKHASRLALTLDALETAAALPAARLIERFASDAQVLHLLPMRSLNPTAGFCWFAAEKWSGWVSACSRWAAPCCLPWRHRRRAAVALTRRGPCCTITRQP